MKYIVSQTVGVSVFLIFLSIGNCASTAESQLQEIAASIKNHEKSAENLEKLKAFRQRDIENARESTVYVLLLSGFTEMESGGTPKEAELLLQRIKKRENLEPWESFCKELLKVSIDSRAKRRDEVLESLDWMLEVYPQVEEELKNNDDPQSLISGWTKGKGPLRAALLLTKGNFLIEKGDMRDGRETLQRLIRDYPKCGWATSARNRLHHLENQAEFQKLMKEQ